MVVLYWILGIVGGLVVLAYLSFVAFIVHIVRKPEPVRIEPLSGEEIESALELVPVARQFADGHGWTLAYTFRLKMPGVDRRELYWAVEPGHRYFSAVPSSVDPSISRERHDFSTILRPRAGGEAVRVMTSTDMGDMDGPGEFGLLGEAFPGISCETLQQRHNAAVAHAIEIGDCRPYNYPGSPSDLTVQMLKKYFRCLRRNPLRLLCAPIQVLWIMLAERHKPIARRFPRHSKTMRRLRGEMMHSPRGYA